MPPEPRMSRVGAVIIGRNEGARLIACLASVKRQVERMVYVDSGSTDGSVEAARAAGCDVVLLDPGQPFTAARARNAGFARLMDAPEPPEFVQFIDGDCELREGWVEAALTHLAAHPKAAAVCGRRRERYPEASLYNRLIDLEWNTAVGEVRACGGDVLMRSAALAGVGGYDPLLIAGEEPELCVRLRRAGWTIWRLDREMTWHDAGMTRFSQWWTRARRAGHAYAEGAALHGRTPERHNMARLRRTLFWGLGLPLAILLGLFITPWALALALLWPAKILLLIRRGHDPVQAFFLTLGNLAEALGVLTYVARRLLGRRGSLIEYKS